MNNWLLIASGMILIALGVVFLVPVWLAWPAGLALVAVGIVRWTRGRRLAATST
jgi:hypothetical protein